MNTGTGWIRGAMLAAVVVGLLGVRDADARGSRGGHPGGRSRPPRVSAPRRSFKAPAQHRAPAPKAPRMPRAASPARANVARPRPKTRTVQPHATPAPAVAGRATTTTHATRVGTSAHSYTYGAGTQARRYKAYGYGRGYRNRYVGGRRGYGRSQGNNRAIVSRLRSVHAGLARLDHDYKGHRVRAMHSISMAVRQLSHRAMVYRGAGFSPLLNNRMRQGGAGAGARRPQPLSQAQSDARVSQALRTLQGINMQLSNQGYHTASQARARGHVQRAGYELNTALSIR